MCAQKKDIALCSIANALGRPTRSLKERERRILTMISYNVCMSSKLVLTNETTNLHDSQLLVG